MAATNVPQTTIPLSMPNSSSPICEIRSVGPRTDMMGNPIPDDPGVGSAEGSLGFVTKAWLYIFGTFVVRAATGQGWAAPTGTGSRASINADFTTAVSASPTQAQVTALRNQVIALQKALAQLIIDETTSGTISS